MYDLHTHTVFSDGVTTPEVNAQLATAAGLRGVALTDHDTTEGWDRQAAACRVHGLEFIPGLELSTELEGLSIHILGYWVDAAHPALAAECDRLRNERARRAGRILQRLTDLGLPVTLDRVLAHAADAPIGRPHIAAAMVEAGHVPDTAAAFDRYLADGGPAWVPKHAVLPEEGVRLIRQAGGVAVLAHPGLEDRSRPVHGPLLDRLVGAGLSGIEADHAAHPPEVAAYWREVAAERELLVTGSSDFHGTDPDTTIGAATTSREAVEALQGLAASGAAGEPTRGR
jgi:3',5'-nucleoside bisphosphate phosphatase